ncbi:MAG: hypothetical protein R3C26_12555 [Calditrichia bacterium]
MELKSRIDAAFLPVVNKPTRFLGNEFDAFVKNSDEIKLKIALCYADLYDAGMRNIAFESLYYLLNDAKTIWAERCYFPGIDAEATLQSAEIPLFSLESKTALNQFQIITFFLQDWLSCTNVLSMLNVAQLPLRQSERSDAAPLIIGCGPVMSNPEPLTAFFDAVIIGDPETAMLEIATIVEQQSGATKADVLKLLCGIAGVYVPSLYQPQFNSFREFQGLSQRQPMCLPEFLPEPEKPARINRYRSNRWRQLRIPRKIATVSMSFPFRQLPIHRMRHLRFDIPVFCSRPRNSIYFRNCRTTFPGWKMCRCHSPSVLRWTETAIIGAC